MESWRDLCVHGLITLCIYIIIYVYIYTLFIYCKYTIDSIECDYRCKHGRSLKSTSCTLQPLQKRFPQKWPVDPRCPTDKVLIITSNLDLADDVKTDGYLTDGEATISILPLRIMSSKIATDCSLNSGGTLACNLYLSKCILQPLQWNHGLQSPPQSQDRPGPTFSHRSLRLWQSEYGSPSRHRGSSDMSPQEPTAPEGNDNTVGRAPFRCPSEHHHLFRVRMPFRPGFLESSRGMFILSNLERGQPR